MLEILGNPVYRRLLAAQVVALMGTGLATVALALLAYQLAGAEAGTVLGTALFIKMVAYVSISPLAGAMVARLPRKAVLIGMDAVRAGVALLLPFVDQVWQVYGLILVLQAASAIFTPTFQATIPDVLPEERDYTRALSLSRLAYDLENLLSPALAALLLLVMSFHALFAGTAIGFALSALLVASVTLPAPAAGRDRSFRDRLTRGLRIYLATPRLRGLLALNLAAAAAGAMVIVNTVVIARGMLGRSDSELGLAMAVFGAGSMTAALLLPPLLDRRSDRVVMLAGGGGLGVLTGLFAILIAEPADAGLWLWMLGIWFLLGGAYAAVLTPSGRLLRRSSHAEDRPAVFAAQFALSHACWLVTYPLAGWLGWAGGMPVTLLVLGLASLAGTAAAALAWPSRDMVLVTHRHEDLPDDHPHLREGEPAAGGHVHPFVIDDLHPTWPPKGL